MRGVVRRQSVNRGTPVTTSCFHYKEHFFVKSDLLSGRTMGCTLSGRKDRMRPGPHISCNKNVIFIAVFICLKIIVVDIVVVLGVFEDLMVARWPCADILASNSFLPDPISNAKREGTQAGSSSSSPPLNRNVTRGRTGGGAAKIGSSSSECEAAIGLSLCSKFIEEHVYLRAL